MHDDVGAETRSAAAGTATRTCCPPPASRRTRGPARPAPRCRRCSAAGWSASRPRSSGCAPGGTRPGPRPGRRAARRSSPAPSSRRPWRTADRCRRTRRPGSPRGRPGRHTARSSVSSAARPLANASPRRPPSIAARHSCSASRVGLPERLYSYPRRGAADGVLRVRARLVDRRHHRPGPRVRLLAGVDGEGVEAVRVSTHAGKASLQRWPTASSAGSWRDPVPAFKVVRPAGRRRASSTPGRCSRATCWSCPARTW